MMWSSWNSRSVSCSCSLSATRKSKRCVMSRWLMPAGAVHRRDGVLRRESVQLKSTPTMGTVHKLRCMHVSAWPLQLCMKVEDPPTTSRPRTKQRNSRPGRRSRHARSTSTCWGRVTGAAAPFCPLRCPPVTMPADGSVAGAAAASLPAVAAMSCCLSCGCAAASAGDCCCDAVQGSAEDVTADGTADKVAQPSKAWQMSCAMRSELCSSSSTCAAAIKNTVGQSEARSLPRAPSMQGCKDVTRERQSPHQRLSKLSCLWRSPMLRPVKPTLVA